LRVCDDASPGAEQQWRTDILMEKRMTDPPTHLYETLTPTFSLPFFFFSICSTYYLSAQQQQQQQQYHYYRMYSVYNEIRVFVSAYVWMTGFGNFLYFDKSQDFTLERAVSMWIRINYFPLLLSLFLSVPLELYYVVPLHTAAFFITMATCYLAQRLEAFYPRWTRDTRNMVAIATCLVVHVLFYETPAVNFLKLFSDEYYFRFQADKYSPWVGILSGFLWHYFKTFLQWCHGPNLGIATTTTTTNVTSDAAAAGMTTPNADSSTALVELPRSCSQIQAAWAQRVGGVALLALWYCLFGYMTDKFSYNPLHPYIFWMPVAGWLMIRNSSRYLTEVHLGVMEFFGRITLETYVLQFHVFMCQNVQHIPVVIPGATADGPELLKALNMLTCGLLFVGLAFWARQITVTTQTTLTELLALLIRGPTTPTTNNTTDDQDKVPLKSSNHEMMMSDDKTIGTTSSSSSSSASSMSSNKNADV
jgi:N-acetylneuraminate 9-O-acetyltransferase